MFLINSFIDYIEESCKNIEDTPLSYKYKKELLDEMTERAKQVTQAGLYDKKVLTDLIADEFPDLEENYRKYEKEDKKKARAKLLRKIFAIGGIIVFFATFAAYFTVSKITGAWSTSWLIILAGLFSMIIFYTSFLIKRLYRRNRFLHPIARILLAGCIMLFTVFWFLFVLMTVRPADSWPIVILGILIGFIADLIFAFYTKQKFRTVSLFVYMPAIFTMLYITLAGFGIITWGAGWPIILLGLVVDLIIALTIVASNAKYFMYKQEVDEQ